MSYFTSQLGEITRQRDDAEMLIPSLKAKIALLKKACREKDETVTRYIEELKQFKHGTANLTTKGRTYEHVHQVYSLYFIVFMFIPYFIHQIFWTYVNLTTYGATDCVASTFDFETANCNYCTLVVIPWGITVKSALEMLRIHSSYLD